ncbi:MAG: Flp pilus assembly protein CpaB [Bdellovibrionales bacterium GWC1_52_8]|nr:MAG: Flp pilus assembly protein CpaB [Bdellovibrionales bacterium GWB1_52_6]OFZ03405.1 MAG: Flp pilus assembly protein CpaB [Bdellovibrionales bacterium GWA1_52_35]OFZ35311.1 MAG: Flp pilus assembly protein CpaB [Bdellovibrionales bacterium GWC1_52_8]
MNNRAVTLSLIMGVLAVLFVQSYIGSLEEGQKKKFGTEVNVLKAKVDIKDTETIDETMIELSVIPRAFLEPSAVSFAKREKQEESELEGTRVIKSLAGSVAMVPIKKGEQITLNKMTHPGIRTGLAPQVAPGRRAVSIGISETTSIGKLVKPGDRVDLIAVIDSGGKDTKIVKTVLQDIVVLAVGRSVTNNVPRVIEADPTGGRDRVRPLAEDFTFNSVTLEVEPAQVQMLALLSASGENLLTLSLRNNDDTERVNLPGVMLMDVLGADAGRVQRVPAKR